MNHERDEQAHHPDAEDPWESVIPTGGTQEEVADPWTHLDEGKIWMRGYPSDDLTMQKGNDASADGAQEAIEDPWAHLDEGKFWMQGYPSEDLIMQKEPEDEFFMAPNPDSWYPGSPTTEEKKDTEEPELVTLTLTAGVGAGSAKNLKADVLLIQERLKGLGLLAQADFDKESASVAKSEGPSVAGDQLSKTITAIKTFQEQVLHWPKPSHWDGNISGPSSNTLKGMNAPGVDAAYVQKRMASYPDIKKKRLATKEAEEKQKAEQQLAEQQQREKAERLREIREAVADEENAEKFLANYPDTLQLAEELKPYTFHNPKFVQEVLGASGRTRRDNIVYALMQRLSDGELAQLDGDLVSDMKSALEAWFVSTQDYEEEIKRLTSDTEKSGGEGKLDQLMEKKRLSADEIALVRSYISNLDESKQAGYYLRLQSKINYRNQRNNQSKATESDKNNNSWMSSDSKAGDIMCNLTSVVMAFEYLGVKNPNPKIQFEDYLEKQRVEKHGSSERGSADTWKLLAKEFDISQSTIYLNTSSQEKISSKLRPFLEKGAGVVISAFTRKGHIVRLQNITKEGLIVDDPFGDVSSHLEDRETGKSGYRLKGENGYDNRNLKESETGKGENNLWAWGDISKIKIKYAVVFTQK